MNVRSTSRPCNTLYVRGDLFEGAVFLEFVAIEDHSAGHQHSAKLQSLFHHRSLAVHGRATRESLQ